jgi:oxygen-independent coproporphyrinogen-3 oxidase
MRERKNANQQKPNVNVHNKSKCSYCNFNKYVNPKEPPHERLVNAMKKEIDYYFHQDTYGLSNRKINSIYFGGGTPSMRVNHIIVVEWI